MKNNNSMNTMKISGILIVLVLFVMIAFSMPFVTAEIDNDGILKVGSSGGSGTGHDLFNSDSDSIQGSNNTVANYDFNWSLASGLFEGLTIGSSGIASDGNIYTTISTADIWVGSSILSSANAIIEGTGEITATNFTGNISATNVTIDDNSNLYVAHDAEGAFDELASAIFAFLNGTNWKPYVLDKDLTEPPSSGNVSGDRYIVGSQSGAWYDSSWTYRQAITIDAENYVKGGNYTNFAVLVNISGANDIFSNAQTDGSDLVFTVNDKTTEATCEMEEFDANKNISMQWVLLPELGDNSNVTIYAYYGNDAFTGNCRRGETGVWDSEYLYVHHFNGTETFTVQGVNDNPTVVGTPDDVYDGYGINQYYSGSTEGISMACNNCEWEAPFVDRTHTIVFNTTADITTRQVLWAEGGGTNGAMCWILSGELYCGWWSESSLWPPNDGNTHAYHSVPIEANHNNYVLSAAFFCSLGGSPTICDTGNYSMWLNGTEVNASGTALTPISGHSGNGGIAYTGGSKQFHDGSFSGQYFDGQIKELEVSNEYWNLDRHRTFNNMWNDEAFLSFGAEEEFGSGGAASGDWEGYEGNVTTWNSSAWTFEAALDGDTRIVLDELLPYTYDADNDRWTVASLGSGSHSAQADLFGCGGANDNICWHVTEDEHTEVTQYANLSQNGLMTTQHVSDISSALAGIISGIQSQSYINATITEDRVINISFNQTIDLNLTRSLNVSKDVFVGGNFTMGNGAILFWGNGTVEVTGSGYGGATDSYLNLTGDNVTQLNANKTYFLGRDEFPIAAPEMSNWWGTIFTDKMRAIMAQADIFRVINTLYAYNNNTINIDANVSISSGDVVIWSNGTVEASGFVDTDTTCAGNGTCADIVYSTNITTSCPAGTYAYGFWVNASVKCRTDNDNTTSYDGVIDTFVNITGDNVTVDANLTYWLGNSTSLWGKIWTDTLRSHTIIGGANSEFEVNSTGGVNLSAYQSCLLTTDSSGNIICSGYQGPVYSFNTFSTDDGDVDTNSPNDQLNVFGSSGEIVTKGTQGTATLQIGIIETWVNESGDAMSGDLNITGNLNATGNLTIGTTRVIWSNGTIEIGSQSDTTCEGNGTCGEILYVSNITSSCDSGQYQYGRWANGSVRCRADSSGGGSGVDSWVNETGDVMTGNLSISDGTGNISINSDGTINMTSWIHVNETYIGNPDTDANYCMRWADDGGFSRTLCWVQVGFQFSTAVFTDGLQSTGDIRTSGSTNDVYSSDDIYTTTDTGDIYAGGSSPTAAESYLGGLGYLNLSSEGSDLTSLEINRTSTPTAGTTIMSDAMKWTETINMETDEDSFTGEGWNITWIWNNSNIGGLQSGTIDYALIDVDLGEITSGIGVLANAITILNLTMDFSTAGNYFLEAQNGSTQVMSVAENGDTVIAGSVEVNNLNATAGPITSGRQPMFQAYYSGASYTLIDDNVTKVELDTEVYDPLSAFNNGETGSHSYSYTPTIEGFYQVNFAAGFGSQVDDSQSICYIYKNGASEAAGRFTQSGTSQTGCMASDIIYLDSNDYLEFYVRYHDGVGSDSALYVSGSALTRASAYLLG